WDRVKPEILRLAATGEVIPLTGAGISLFAPTALPLGWQLLDTTLGSLFAFHGTTVFESTPERDEERILAEVTNDRSAEVILQAVSEALLLPGRMARIYEGLGGAAPNPLHQALAEALVRTSVPALFTTNQDRCFET